MLNKLSNNIKSLGIKLLLLMFFVTSIVIIKDNVKASSIEDFEYYYSSYGGYFSQGYFRFDGYVITGYNGQDNNLEIPSSIDGKPVRAINSNVFMNFSSFVSVSIPDSIILLDNYAFANCSNLVKVDIYSTNLTIGNYCFSDCINLEEFNCYNGLPKFGKNVFTGASNFCYAEDIGNHFRDEELETVIVSEGTTEITESIFKGCENLKTIYIDSPQLINLDSRVFYGCNNLSKVVITEDNPYYTVVDDIIYTKDMKKLIRCLPGKRGRVNIPSTVESISSYAFHSCKYLEDELVIPDSVTEIFQYAFYGCMSEIPLYLSNSLTGIPDYAFANSKFIGNLTIPDSITQINSYAFYNCVNFDGNLTIGNNVNYINNLAFFNCNNLKGNLTFPESVRWISNGAFALCSGLDGTIQFLNGPNYYDNYIEEFAFSHDINIKEVISEKPLISNNYSNGIFANCASLKKVNSVRDLGRNAFLGCKNLTDINIEKLSSDCLRGLKNMDELRIAPSAGAEIGRTALAECPKLKTLYIPSSINSIADNAFYKTENLQDIYVDRNREEVNYAYILESVCNHVHYKDSKYTITKLHNDDIEITDIESDYDEGYKVGSTYKFKVEPKLGYTINNLRVVLKIDENENQIGYEEERELISDNGIYTIENINRNMQIVFETNSSLINPNAESDS